LFEFGDSRLPARFWSKVHVVPEASAFPGACWIWSGAQNGSMYGKFWDGERDVPSHRHSYNVLVMETAMPSMDHLCRVTLCVNPDHLEPVTQRINILRGNSPAAANAAATHCPYGHKYTESNTYIRPDRGSRECRKCMKRWAGHPDSVAHAQKTHCPQGHPYDELNTYISPRGDRQCRECVRTRSREYQRKRAASSRAARGGR